MPPRLPPLLAPPISFAHRGARAHAPENTMEAFRLARRLGSSGLETDVWLTADGVAVIDHDGEIGGLLRKRSIGRLRRRDLPDHLPDLEEFYAEFGDQVDVSIDVKDPAAFELVVEIARSAGAEDRLWLCHPDLDLLVEWRRSTSARLVHSTRLSRLKHGPERHAALLRERGIDVVNFRQNDWTGGLVTLYHRFELLTLGWDAQHPRQIANLFDAGIDGVFSDHVDRLVEAHRLFFGEIPS